nr:MAG TPA: hypothetical protein [Caudoviricetes sp.]
MFLSLASADQMISTPVVKRSPQLKVKLYSCCEATSHG